MNRTNGKIAEQSRQKIIRALLTVMEQYDYKEITVTQIAQEAGLSRKTFYRLFSDKDEILSLLFDGSFHVFFGQVKVRRTAHYWEVVQHFFYFWEERRDLLFLLQRNHLLAWVLEQSYQYSMEIFTFVRSKETADSFGPLLPYMLAYSVGGMHCMLFQWVEMGMNVPSSELIAALSSGFASENL